MIRVILPRPPIKFVTFPSFPWCLQFRLYASVSENCLWQHFLLLQSLSVGISTTVTVTGQQLAGLLRPVTAAATRSVHIGSVPSTLPGVQFISKPVQILQSSATSAPQLPSAVPTASQVLHWFKLTLQYHS